jgi:hypothetical protein
LLYLKEGPGGSMSYVVRLPSNSYKPITNAVWVRARLCKLPKTVEEVQKKQRVVLFATNPDPELANLWHLVCDNT